MPFECQLNLNDDQKPVYSNHVEWKEDDRKKKGAEKDAHRSQSQPKHSTQGLVELLLPEINICSNTYEIKEINT